MPKGGTSALTKGLPGIGGMAVINGEGADLEG